MVIFHEYGHYETWHFFPRLPNQERFREHVIATWRESGGEPDGAVPLATLLPANGFTIRSARPHLFCVRPTEYMWQWPATFIETYLPRLIEMGRIDQQFADKVRDDLARCGKESECADDHAIGIGDCRGKDWLKIRLILLFLLTELSTASSLTNL